MGTRTDAELISVLQRCWLLPEAGKSDPVAEAKFDLNATVGDEGTPGAFQAQGMSETDCRSSKVRTTVLEKSSFLRWLVHL